MRDRLIELIRASGCAETWDYYTDDFKKPNPIYELADHLLANGVIVPPVKVGDTVYTVYIAVFDESGEEKLYMDIGKAVSLSMQEDGLWLFCRYESGLTYWHKLDADLGKTVFLTYEEAEAALKGGEEK
mgnify:CR=1 FL=1